MIEVRRFEPARRADFDRLHCAAEGADWCQCVAWWAPTWPEFAARTAEENRREREALCARGEYDGYLLYEDGAPAGWCQAGPRDRLEKLVAQYRLTPDRAAWAITCFRIAPGRRRRGLATRLLEGVLADLPARGARRVEAFPKRGAGLDEGDLWTGPEALFLAAGFRVVGEDPRFPVLALEISA